MRHLPIALLALSSPLFAQYATAVWSTLQGGNGHTYSVFKPGTTLDWNTANAAAIAAGGYLCTITSAAENAFVFALVDDPMVWIPSFGAYNLGPWIGGVQAPASVEPAGGWGWVSAEPMTYTNWVPGQPNNSCLPSEDHMHFFTNSTALRGGQWNDLSPGSCNLPLAYVVEWDTHECFAGTVGLPSSGPFDVLAVNGSHGGRQRTVESVLNDSFVLSMVPPPGTNGALFLLMGAFGAANGTATLPLPFGELCANTSFVLGSLMQAPWTQQVPAGLGLVGPLTFQAIMLTDPFAPLQAVTNGLILDFVPSQPPSITSVTPLSAAVGLPITVSGANFNNSATVSVHGVTVPVASGTANTITFAYPPNVPCGAVLQVTNVNSQSATAVLNPTPTITNTFGSSGPASGGATFVLIGAGFAPGTTVLIGGAAMTLNVTLPGVLSGTTPPGVPGSATVVVTTPGGCTARTTYTYL